MFRIIPLINFFILSTFLFLIPFSGFSQGFEKHKLKWGKVSKEDLEMKIYSEDKNAAAVVLGELGTITFDVSGERSKIILTKHIRIKVLSEGGLDWANISLPYYHDMNREKINSIKGQSIQADGTISKLSKKNIYEKENDEYWTEIKFAIPNVQVGSVFEYIYEKEIKNISQLPYWYFQSSIPKRWSQISVSFPYFYHYVSIKEFTNGIKENRKAYRSSIAIPKKVNDGYMVSGDGIQKASVDMTDYTYVMEKVAAFEKDIFVANSLDYYAKIYFQLQATEFSVGDVKPVEDAWRKYINQRIDSPFFGEQYTNKKKYKKIIAAVSPLITNAKTDDEKISIISDFILNNVKWNNYFATYTEKNLDDAFLKNLANSAEMNLMGIALLNHFGVQSYPILVSTRENGKVVKSYPILNQFNHVVIRTNTGKLFDFSGLSLGEGLIRPEALNSIGLAILGKDDYSWIEFSVLYSSTIKLIKASLDEKGGLQGEMSIMNDNYAALINRSYFHDKKNNDEYAKRFFKKDLRTAKIEGLKVKNEKEMDKKFISTMDFVIPEYTNSNNELIYLPVMLGDEWTWINKLLEKEKRNYPLDFPFPFKDKYIINVDIPEGYVIDEIPENINIITPDKDFQFSYLSFFENGKLQVIISLSSKKYHYSIEEFNYLKDIFKSVSEKVGELIVLKKK